MGNNITIIKEAIQEAFGPVARLEELKAKEYLKPAEVEELFPLPVSTLEKMRKDGAGPRFVKRGKSVFYKAGDIRAFLDSHQQQTC